MIFHPLSNTDVVITDFNGHPTTRAMQLHTRRALNRTLVLTVLILLAPAFILIGLVILLTSSGTVSFRQ